MDVLLNLDPVTSIYDLKGLRSLYDTVELHIRALKSLGIPSQSYGGLLCSMLINKLPRYLRIRMSHDIKNDCWNLDRLLRKSIKHSTTTGSSSNSHRDQKSKYRGRQLPSAAVLKMDSSPITCTCCHGSHTSNSCQTVSNVTAQKDILRKGVGVSYV